MGMMRYKLLILGCLFSLLSNPVVRAQSDSTRLPNRLVVFLPLQLDSVYTPDGVYRLKKFEFPKFISGPLEFYEGMEYAFDSLQQRNADIDVWVIDTRSAEKILATQLEIPEIQTARVWVLYGNAAESRQLADAAKILQIPLINVNLPNDGSLKDKPNYFLWNATLETQCTSIYRYLQKHHALDRILIVRKKGSMEDRIVGLLETAGKQTSGVPLKYMLVDVSDSINPKELKLNMDTTQRTLLLGASLDDRFARALATSASKLLSAGFKIELLGMSTWENVREFATAQSYPNLEITIPTPFYYPRTDKHSQRIQARFSARFFSRPSDLFFRGYELTWLLYPLLTESGGRKAIDELPGIHTHLFTELDWQPITDPATSALNYFENKKLYFIKRLAGTVRSVR